MARKRDQLPWGTEDVWTNRRTVLRGAAVSGATLSGLWGVSGAVSAQSEDDLETSVDRLTTIRDKFDALGQTVDDVLLVDYRHEGLNALEDEITDLNLKKGELRSLLAKIEAARSSNTRAGEAALAGDEEEANENEDATDGQLGAIANRLSALAGKKIPEETANHLKERANALIQARKKPLAPGDNISSPQLSEDFLNKLNRLGGEFSAILREFKDSGQSVSFVDMGTDPKIRIENSGSFTVGLSLLSFSLVEVLRVSTELSDAPVDLGIIAKLQALGAMTQLESVDALLSHLDEQLTAFQFRELIGNSLVAHALVHLGVGLPIDLVWDGEFDLLSPLHIAILVAGVILTLPLTALSWKAVLVAAALVVLSEFLESILEHAKESGEKVPMGQVELPGNVDGEHNVGGEYNCAVAGTFDGSYYTTIKDGETNPATSNCANTILQVYSPPPTGDGEATLEAEKTIVDSNGDPVEISALAWDESRGQYWGAHEADNAVYLIDRGNPEDPSEDAQATFKFAPNVQATLEDEPGVPADGLAVDTESDTLWYSPDVDDRVFHFDTDGTRLKSLTPETDRNGNKNGLISGVLVGDEWNGRPTLYLGRNGELEIIRVYADTGEFISQSAAADSRVEDLTLDSTTYHSNAILAKDARAGFYWAFQVGPSSHPV